jgi:hypothetical protein
MKQIFTFFLLIFLSCTTNNKNSINSIKQDPLEINAIKKLLTAQQECWNNGDIDGFMKGYWNSENLIFTSSRHQPTYGWKATLDRYKNSYPTKSSMGVFNFEISNITLISEKTAKLKGKWELIRKDDNPNGLFWLDIEKFNENWLIIKDSTLSFEL